jgi:SAM-dependent methyltransferase
VRSSIKRIATRMLPATIAESISETLNIRRHAPIAKHYTQFFTDKSGIEIGGPSNIFRRVIPIYPAVSSLDGVNFSRRTTWEGDISGDNYVFFAEKPGKQHIMEASDLSVLENESYDFLLSSNCLEHVANPLKALEEWVRVVKKGGHIFLILPKKEDNFDHRRAITPFEHLLEDHKNDVSEHDLTHLEEIIALHDLSMDPAAGDLANFKRRSEQNFANRCLHHHVFDDEIIRKMFEFAGVTLIRKNAAGGNYLALGEK